MIEKSPSLLKLLQQLQKIPYVASKNIYRVAGYLLTLEPEHAQQLCATIMATKQNIVSCNLCFVWHERDQECFYCFSESRNKSIICVVETWHELMAIEKTGGYTGMYHILGGSLSPLDGIEPDDLNVNELVLRINDSIKEVIIATNQTPEGEATAAYIGLKLKNSTVMLTCLARGIPVGSSLEYTDRVTIHKALHERRLLHN